MEAGESQLASVDGMSVGIMSATQGSYSTAQFLLDLTQGARISSSAYPTASAPTLTIAPTASGAAVAGWNAAVERAEEAPQLLRPGLLASQIPGGAGYAGTLGTNDLDAVAAADTGGVIASDSLGSPRSLLAHITAQLREKRLVVADLPAGTEGLADLRQLSAEREPGELMLVVQRVPDAGGGELLWTAAAGLGGAGGRALTSASTKQRGLIAAVDLAPTILEHLGMTPLPADMRGRALETDGPLHSASLRSLMARLHVVGGRRLKALAVLLIAWALLVLACAPRPLARARAMRAGALAVLWAPVVVLIPAALEPSAAVEYATIALGCLAFGAFTDLVTPWPRAVIPPAVVSIVLLTLDALSGRQLLMRSVLGPNPILGARFYGIGNELKSGLAVLVLAAVAAALYPAVRGRRAALSVAAAGALLAVVEGSARIGAGVGGVILVSAGFAVATVLLLPGAVSRRRALAVIVAPVAGLVVLAALDLVTAHGGGHFTGSILHARSAGDLRDVIVRRYGAAWNELKNHTMPFATALALACGGFAIRMRDRLLAPVRGDAGWPAALGGGLAAGVVGALAEDSGPVLLVVAVFALGCVVTYLWGGVRASPPDHTHATADQRSIRRSS
ncbi:MAG TPA: hypothetical protein VNR42_04490 [Solirubrobacteraceae bacterium]|nr:hypothetical protein [Solirubrobacteraceae bacterium]